MNQPKLILSTKKLAPNQKSFLLNAGFSLMEVDFIKIDLLDFKCKNGSDLLLFTSQNAVKSVLQNNDIEFLKNIPAICVGKKTALLLEKNGFEVLEFTSYAEALAAILIEKYKENKISFFGGNLSREVLPDAMKSANILFDFYEVYHNSENPVQIEKQPDGILFFSPSGIHSYLKKNDIGNSICFCIGTTTALALKNITENIVIAHEQTIENTLIQCIKYYQKI